MSIDKTVIIGAGHGGVATALELRKRGFEGAIDLLNAEPGLPYERPPLSKAWLISDDDHKATLANEQMFSSVDINFHPSTRATSINRQEKSLTTEGGIIFPYDALILAMGGIARPLPLPGIDAKNVHALRFAADAEKLRSSFSAGGHIGIIGAGYIGLEVAASARKMGLEVTVIELASRCMMRTASEEISEFYENFHRNQGVRFIHNVGVKEVITTNDLATGLKLDNGDQLDCDHVLLAAGGLPDDILAVTADLDSENGIIVDEDARTSDPSIFAIGDIARRPTQFANTNMRIESVQNAQEQAKLAAAAIVGQDRPKPEVPWFWSDQYDLKLQIAGIIRGREERIVRTEGESRFAVFHYQAEQLTAVEAVNAPVCYMAARKAFGMGKTINRAMAGDPNADLRKAIM